jgi:hypothetical protein
MDTVESLNHSVWDCKSHVVFIPNVGERRCTATCDSISGRCSGGWRNRRRVASRKATCCFRSRAHVDRDPAEVRGGPDSGVHQGEERDPFGAGVRGAQEELRGAALLSARVLRVDGRSTRGPDPRLHSEAGTNGRAPGPTGTLALSGHRHLGPERRGRVSDPG